MSWRLVLIQSANLSVQRFLSSGQAQKQNVDQRIDGTADESELATKATNPRTSSSVIICSDSPERGNGNQSGGVSNKSSAGAIAEPTASTVL
jgi:hypothetical protein